MEKQPLSESTDAKRSNSSVFTEISDGSYDYSDEVYEVYGEYNGYEEYAERYQDYQVDSAA